MVVDRKNRPGTVIKTQFATRTSSPTNAACASSLPTCSRTTLLVADIEAAIGERQRFSGSDLSIGNY